MHRYKVLGRAGEGTFSEVLKARAADVGADGGAQADGGVAGAPPAAGALFAIKCMKARYASAEAVAALREVQALLRLPRHAHLIELVEVLWDAASGRTADVPAAMAA